MLRSVRSVGIFVAAVLALCQSTEAHAQGYPVKPVRAPDLAERLSRDGVDVVATSPAQFASHITAELARWAKVIKEAGLRAD